MTKSIISNERVCYVCGTSLNLHRHHIFFGTANRKKSEEDGCWCYLCARHHNMSNFGVHFNHDLDIKLKQECEKKWLETNEKDIDDFIKRYGRNFI